MFLKMNSAPTGLTKAINMNSSAAQVTASHPTTHPFPGEGSGYLIVISPPVDCSTVPAWWLQHCHESLRHDLAPVPLSIFRSNSKFDENSKHSRVKYTWPITTIFCTRHDSVTVVTFARYRCDRSSIFETRAFWIFIEFRIRSKYV